MQLFRTVDQKMIESGLDRTNLGVLRHRFLQVNQARMQRMRLALSHRQQQCLDALPLLFHCNHPMLPGFVTHSTPAGVSAFKPGKEDLAVAKTLARSFCLSSVHTGEDIWGIYLMGSTGTLAHSRHSDFDVWLCHKPGLSQDARLELQQKCDRIAAWAQSLRLEMHFFLMDSEAFKAGTPLRLDAESSGSAQQWLLLDEFYRTALHLAGRVPLWWFVPSATEHDYQQQSSELLDRRFLRESTVLDFGGLQGKPAGEFIGAGLWQLYKAIGSPYKSVLKLLLLEAYVNGYPNIRPLALDYKQLVYQGELRVDELDPYLLAYRRIEHYLGDDLERLELARRCLYFKINIPLSRPLGVRPKSWQRSALEDLVRTWHWSEAHVLWLDRRSAWKAQEVTEEGVRLVDALNHSYDVLRRFADRTGATRSISGDEMHVLGRKLQAAFGRRPDKITCINPGISNDLSEPLLRIRQGFSPEPDAGESTELWQLSGSEQSADAPLQQEKSAASLLLWSHINGMIGSDTRFDLSQAPALDELQVPRILNKLRQWLPEPRPAASHECFTRQAIPTRVLVLLNIGCDPFADRRLSPLLERADPLHYGSTGESLVASVDLITENTWQEISCQRFKGKQALLEALKVYMDLCVPGSHQAPPELTVECVGAAQSGPIGQRVRQWFQSIGNCYYSGAKPPATRYLFQMGGHFYSLQFLGSRLWVSQLKNEVDLTHHLGEPQARYSPLVIDPLTLSNHPLKAVAKLAHPRATCVFFMRQPHGLRLLVVDRMGSLVDTFYRDANVLPTLLALHVFLRSVLARDPEQTASADYGVHPIQFYELAQDDQGHWRSAQRYVASQAAAAPPSLQAVLTHDDSGQLQYSFRCGSSHSGSSHSGSSLSDSVHNGEKSILWQDHRADVFTATVQWLEAEQDIAQPILITDLDLSNCREQLGLTPHWQITRHLRIKIELEQKLKAAQAGLQRRQPAQ